MPIADRPTSHDLFPRPSFFQAIKAYVALTKPRVCTLIALSALLGMAVAAPLPPTVVWWVSLLGITLAAQGAAAMNSILERRLDAQMARTWNRPMPKGDVRIESAWVFAVCLVGVGVGLLWWWANPLSALLTLATALGYAVVYTRWLKPSTPQNIVWGGIAGAMPPLLGATAVTGGWSQQAFWLFLIIFFWTPPHFWSLALYRVEDYARAGIPMLPVVHGRARTLCSIFAYTVVLVLVSLLPWITKAAGWGYLGAALFLGMGYLLVSWRLWRHYSDRFARLAFAYSLAYLSGLFLVLFCERLFLS